MGDLSTLKDHYELEFKRKETLENKANNMTTIAGVVATLLFGFGQFLIEKLTALHYYWLSYIIAILLTGTLASLASIVLSVCAFRVQKYYYVIGHSAVDKPSLQGRLNANADGSLNLNAATGNDNAELNAYKECIGKNSEMNDSKARLIEASLWTFVSSVAFIAILLGWLLIAPTSFPR